MLLFLAEFHTTVSQPLRAASQAEGSVDIRKIMMISKAMTFYDVTQAVMGNLHTIFFNFMTAAFPPMVSRVWRARGELGGSQYSKPRAHRFP